MLYSTFLSPVCKLRSRRAYHVAVAIERVQDIGLVGAGIRLNSPQRTLVCEE